MHSPRIVQVLVLVPFTVTVSCGGSSSTSNSSDGGTNAGGVAIGGSNSGGSSSSTGGASGSASGGVSDGGSTDGGATNTAGSAGASAGGDAGAGGSGNASEPSVCDPIDGICDNGGECLCYQDGPITSACYCTKGCTQESDCLVQGLNLTCGGCEPNQLCLPEDAPSECCDCRCAAPDTPIETPTGPRPIAELEVGDWVMSLNRGELEAVPIVRTRRVPQSGHFVVRTLLENGTVLDISGGHPTADGRRFDALAPGDRLGTARIVSLQTVAYEHAFTHDILPDSDSGTYIAGGALIGSTLAVPAADHCVTE